MGTGEQNIGFVRPQNVSTFFADLFDIPFIQTEQVETDDQNFPFAVIHAETVHKKVIGNTVGFVIKAVTGKKRPDLRGDLTFEEGNFHKANSFQKFGVVRVLYHAKKVLQEAQKRKVLKKLADF